MAKIIKSLSHSSSQAQFYIVCDKLQSVNSFYMEIWRIYLPEVPSWRNQCLLACTSTSLSACTENERICRLLLGNVFYMNSSPVVCSSLPGLLEMKTVIFQLKGNTQSPASNMFGYKKYPVTTRLFFLWGNSGPWHQCTNSWDMITTSWYL